jgi:hypothetical protein
MHINDTGCCAMKEICGLEDTPTTEQRLDDVCSMIASDYCHGDDKLHASSVSGFYVFTGVVASDYAYHMGKKPTYGQEFAAYITRNGLGTVTASVAARNRVNHPDHKVKVWVWAPNAKKLAAWYNRRLQASKKGL